MRPLLRLLLLALMIVALAGCGGSNTTGDAATSGVSQTPVIPAVSTSTNILVTGAVEFTIGDSTYNMYSEEEVTEDSLVRQFYFNNGSQQVVVIMFYGIEPAVGEYEIAEFDFLGEGAEGVTVLVLDGSSEAMQNFALNPSGMVRVDSAGETFGGSFEFTAQGGAIGVAEEDMQTVNVTGTFANLQRMDTEE